MAKNAALDMLFVRAVSSLRHDTAPASGDGARAASGAQTENLAASFPGLQGPCRPRAPVRR